MLYLEYVIIMVVLAQLHHEQVFHISTKEKIVMSTFDPTTAPVAGKEPMLLLDVTGSMNYAASESSSTARKTVIQEAISIVVEKLAQEDSEASHEESGGGLRTITFANGQAKDLEDLNPNNLRTKWERINWDGGTLIMPG